MGKTGAIVGCNRAVMWPRTEGETTTFGEAVDMSERIISVTYQLGTATGSLDAGDKVVDTYTGKTGASGSINVVNTTSAEDIALFGETDENGTNVEATTDLIPYSVLAYQGNRSDGKVNLYKIMKCMLVPGSETAETVKKDNITYNTTNISYTADADGTIIRYVRKAVDPVEDAEIIENWFTQADYHAPEV
jgi:hypothetical protein